MLYFGVLLLLVGSSCGQICGIPPLCYCNTEIGILACLNETLETLPTFSTYEKANTVHLDIANTYLKTLPYFNVNEWPHLKVVDLRSNIHLRICKHLDEIFPFQDITLITDCTLNTISFDTTETVTNNPDTTITTPDTKHSEHIYSSISLGIHCMEIVIFIVYYAIYRNLRRRHSYFLPKMQMTSFSPTTIDIAV